LFVSPPQTTACATTLVSIVIGERLAMALSGGTNASSPASPTPWVIVPQIVIVSSPQTTTLAIPLDSIMIGERLTTTLSGVYMPFRRSPS
jgi:hypothetical protein